jgi:hypothetical protein
VVVSIIQRSGALRSAESYSKADDAAPIADKGDAQSTRPRVFGKRGLIDKPSTPPNASRHERKSPSFNVTAGMIAVVVIAVVTLPLFFLLFGSTKPGMPFGMASIYRSVSDSAAQQYYIARRQGDPIQICVQAGLAAAAFLQAQDEPNYRAWKNKESWDCAAAGIPR